MPFPGGAEAALEFAALEKLLLDRGNGNGGSARSREPPPVPQRPPISDSELDSTRWMLAGAGLAAAAAGFLLLLGSGVLTPGFLAVLRAIARP